MELTAASPLVFVSGAARAASPVFGRR